MFKYFTGKQVQHFYNYYITIYLLSLQSFLNSVVKFLLYHLRIFRDLIYNRSFPHAR